MISRNNQFLPASSSIHVWPNFLAGFILLAVFFSNIFSPLESFGRWATYIAVVFFCIFTLISGQNQKFNSTYDPAESRHQVWLLLPTIMWLSICLNGVLSLQKQEGLEFSPFKILITLIFLVLAALIPFITRVRLTLYPRSASSILFLFSLLILVITCFSETRYGEVLASAVEKDFLLFLAVSLVLGFSLGQVFKFSNGTKPAHKLASPIAFSFLLLATALLTLRVDQIFNIAGAKFHWSYFTGAIDTLRSGGTLLWDTPSQYGIGPIFIPTLLPINNSTTAFLIFQASLMFITVGFSLYVLKRITKNTTSFVILGLIWILTYFFADPALIGPQPYPSSSAVRFGPSLIFASFLLLVLFGKLKETKPLIYKIGLPLIAAISFCWSAESSIYSLAILGAYILGNLLYGEERSIRSAALKPLSLVATGIVSAVLLICVLVYTRVGHLPDFGMFFMYSRGYAEGFGSYGLEFASPVWLLILVVSLLSVSWVVGTSTESKRTFIRMTIVLVGATGAWFSYFVGRAVPDNVIAMLPLIVFPLLVVVAFATPLAAKPVLSVGGEEVPRPVFLWWLSVIAVLLTISTLVLTNPIVKILTPGWLPAFQSSVKPLPWTDEALAPPALITALNSIPAEYAELPIAYEGYHGVLLKTDGVLDWTPNSSQVWIPTPLGLLEEPISAAKQEQILSRFQADAPRDGLFIWDIKNSFPDRAERWKQLIQKTHTCNQVYLSEDYEILQCAVIR